MREEFEKYRAKLSLDMEPEAFFRVMERLTAEYYDAHRDELFEDGEAVLVKPRRLTSVISVRLDSELAKLAGQIAACRGITISELIRQQLAALTLAYPTGSETVGSTGVVMNWKVA